MKCFNVTEKILSTEMDDVDIQTSLALAQDILRKKIIVRKHTINTILCKNMFTTKIVTF